jgi:hypothetical protein
MKLAVNRTWFRTQLEINDLTQRKLGKILKLHESAVGNVIRGTRKLKLKEAAVIAKELSVPLEDVLQASGIPLNGVSSKETLSLSGWVEDNKIHWSTPKGSKSVPKPLYTGGEVEALSLRSQDALSGSLIYYRRFKEVLETEVMGRLCVVKMKTDPSNVYSLGKWPSVLAVVNRGERAGCYKLTAMDGTTLHESVELSFAYPVVWMKF